MQRADPRAGRGRSAGSRSSTGRVLPERDEGPFLKEERKLIDTIAERLGAAPAAAPAARSLPGLAGRRGPASAAARRVVGHHRLPAEDRPAPAHADLAPDAQLPLLERRLDEAQDLLPRFTARDRHGERSTRTARIERQSLDDARRVTDEAFRIAAEHLSAERDRHAASRSGSRTTRRASSSRRSRTRARRSPRSREALERFQQLGGRRTGSSRAPVQVGLRVVARPPVPHRRPRVHQHGQELHRGRRLLRAGAARHLPAAQPRQARAARASGLLPRRRRSSGSSTEYADAARGDQGCRRPGT